MNRIEAVRRASKHVREPHLVITVDGVPLDELLDGAVPGANIAGLVSSLLGWFHDVDNIIVPWQRILPAVGCTGYAPVLICPDDLDLSCSVIVAEVVSCETVVVWQRLGWDASAGSVGSCVRWLAGAGPFCFPRAEYEVCLAAFRVGGGVSPSSQPPV